MRSEREAVVALQQGDIGALSDLVRLHQLKALRTAYGILGERAAAEDVVSEAFLKAYDRIATFDPTRAFEPWFYRLLVNAAIDHRRKMSRSQPTESVPAEPTFDLEMHDLRVTMSRQIRALPALERAALVLHYYLDMDEATIASVLNCPLGTVKSRLHRARERMRRSLVEEDSAHDWSPQSVEGV